MSYLKLQAGQTAVITGAASGFGLELARLAARKGLNLVITDVQRDALDAATAELRGMGVQVAALRGDVSRSEDVHALAEMCMERFGAPHFVINNAGVVSELAPLAEVPCTDLANAVRVGLEAPMLLTAAFLRATQAWTMPRKVLLISSGLGRRAMAGSASYCAAKAGMDHLARAVGLEESARNHGAKIVSLAPGVIDTDMQVRLRTADPVLFPERDRFAGLKSGGHLDSPAVAAAKVLTYLDRPDFGANPVADVRDA